MTNGSASASRLDVGILMKIAATNPRAAPDSLSSSVAAQIYETPYRAPFGQGPAEPVLFDGPLVTQSAGGATSHAGRLRKGVAFSDGTPLSADHVAASLSQVASLRGQAEVQASGDRVLFRLKAENPRFDLALTQPDCGVVLEKAGQLLGTGPYLPAPDARLEAMRLARNPRYRDKVGIDEIRFTIFPPEEDGRPARLIHALESGEADFTTMLSRTDAAAVQGLAKSFKAAAATAILFFNTEKPALADAAVRKALALAVDRLAVTAVSYPNPLAFAATSLLPSIMGMAHDGLTHDLGKARHLLSGAVKPSRLRLLIVWAPRPYLPNPQPAAKLIADQIGALGIQVEIVRPRSGDEYFAKLQAGDYDLVLGGWIADTPDPADFLEAILRSDRVRIGPAAFNAARLKSPAMDAALAQFRRSPDVEQRHRVMELMNKEVPLLPVMYGPTVVVHAWRLRNVVVSPLGLPYFEKFSLGS